MKMGISVIISELPGTELDILDSSIRSVAHQSVPVDEIIVLGHSCSADIDKRVYELQREGINIRYDTGFVGNSVSKKVYGANLARNEWIAFLNADDVWLCDKIEHQMKAVQSRKYRRDICVVTSYYTGYIRADVPGAVDTEMEASCHWEQKSVDELVASYEPHVFSGILLSKNFFLNLVEDYNIQSDWQLYRSIVEHGRITCLDYAYYIHKMIELLEYKKYKIQEFCDTSTQMKELIVAKYGLAFWNERIKKAIKEIGCNEYMDGFLRLFAMFDFGDVEKGSAKETSDIDEYVCRKEIERLILFCDTHRRIGCYGAGDFGRKILKRLGKDGRKNVTCVIVSDSHKSKDELLGIRIFERSDVDLDTLDGIILAMSLTLFPTMMTDLRREYNGEIYTITDSVAYSLD